MFVPIVPCRLADTRVGASNVGARNTPGGPAETVQLAVWGSNGNCAIPNTATGISSNVTAVGPTADSYLTVFPADANPRPTASNLNVTSTSPPTSNQVTVALSATGAIGVYNNGGNVNVIVAKITAVSVRYKDTNSDSTYYSLSFITVPGSASVSASANLVTVDNQLSGSLVFPSPPPAVGPASVPCLRSDCQRRHTNLLRCHCHLHLLLTFGPDRNQRP